MPMLDTASQGPPDTAARSAADEDRTPSALINTALRLEREGHVAQARALLADLRTRSPNWDEIPLRQAESYRAAGEDDRAIAAYEATLLINHRRPEALLGLGTLVLTHGELEAALSLFLRACGVAPDRAEAWDALGSALLMRGDATSAETAFAEAQRLAPDNIAMALRRVDAAVAAGTSQTEDFRLALATQTDPLNVALLTARGVLLDRLGDRTQARDLLETAAALSPASPEVNIALGQTLIRANLIAQAVPVLEAAIALRPDDLNLRNNHAAALVKLHRHREARDALEALIAEHGERSGLLCNLSNALVSLGLQDEGVAAARRAILAEPGLHLGWRTLCNALPYCDGIGGAELLHAYRHAGRLLPRHTTTPIERNRDPARRLTLGLMSPSLKTHPVGWFTIGGIENLDPNQYRIVCIGPRHGTDTIHRRFVMAAQEWHTGETAAPQARAQAIRDLGIDILIDLGGYGDLGMMALCAQRLAPVQVKWVGSQNHSTGLEEIDWFLTDRWETPPELQHHYSERLLLMPDGYVSYSPPPYAPDVGPSPAAASGHVTFGCFNNLAKITRATLDSWGNILRRAPQARLVLKCQQFNDPPTRDRFRAAFAARGVAAARIDLRGGSSHRNLLGEYDGIDIALDPFPYGGGLTTCEALWMGVPTITAPGETFASRHATSHMCNAGLADWVAADTKSYEDLAVSWAENPLALVPLRAGLRQQLRRGPLCDAPRFGAHLGRALRETWHAWCAG
jgi:predicted O-linked N-acetylglucosamine transferase (SPINDLY family)